MSAPQQPLSEALADAVGGRPVRAALFTTYQLDPGFLEAEVIPLLFDRAFSHVDVVRAVQLEEALLRVEAAAVLYDHGGLIPTGGAGGLPLGRAPVVHPRGVFHPKLAALLLDDALVLAVASANLTRAGWWENVECAWVKELTLGAPSSLWADLAALLAELRAMDRGGAAHPAIDRVAAACAGGPAAEGPPYLYRGQQPLPAFLAERIRPRPGQYRLEVLSPYVDGGDAPTALVGLLEALQPSQTRLAPPADVDGALRCTPGWAEAAGTLEGVHFGALPGALLSRGAGASAEVAPRFSHAKVLRLYDPAAGVAWVLIGSPNLTSPAHSALPAGNVEVAVLVRDGDPGAAWWLEPADPPGEARFVGGGEPEAADAAPPPVLVRHLWRQGRTEVRWLGAELPEGLDLLDGERRLAHLPAPAPDRWLPLPEEASAEVAALLRRTCFLQVRAGGGEPATILVGEEEHAHKPSRLLELTPEEILQYWSLLSVSQREAFLAHRAAAVASSEHLPAGPAAEAPESLFDRFAGLFHAFGQLRRHVEAALAAGRQAEAVYRLFGQKYDSLPVLLDTWLGGDADPVHLYVALLTARRLLDQLGQAHPAFLRAHPEEVAALREQLAAAEAVRAGIDLQGAEPDAFFAWYEAMFLEEAP